MENKTLSNLVSILMPAYNVEQYINEAITSIQCQTYQNWELVVIDDGSTDKTLNIIKRLAKSDNRIKVYKNEVNLNIVKTLNKGLKFCAGVFILRMDADDIIGSERVENLVEHINNNKSLKIVGSSMTGIDAKGRVIGQTKFAGSFHNIKRISRYGSPISHIWITYPEIYRKLNGYRDLAGAEDYDFILRAIDAGFECTNLSNNYSYFVRLGRDGNTASTIGLKQLKLKNYVWKLHSKRLSSKTEDLIIEEKEQYLASIPLLEKLHSYSNSFLTKGIINDNLLFKSYYILLSLISPYQIKYLYERVCIKLIILKER
ncbi:MAG: glycosyltransferase involved in cell wall biosynthesis [bacterium]|jgi:glycosyltransferase involved in cell wall biosynthesis